MGYLDIGGYELYPAIFSRRTKWKLAITEIDPSQFTIVMVIFSRLALKGIDAASRNTGPKSPIFKTPAIFAGSLYPHPKSENTGK